MIIKNGFNGKETILKLNSSYDGSPRIELWINEKGKDDRETLSYLSIEELHQLFLEVKNAGLNLFDRI